ncbi:MAG: hypothetical protein FJY98_04640 [Candidatus Liptonbacteria bacterium]|nr:hypothetical protein [Candidatus Liptonbacteria bacterium]
MKEPTCIIPNSIAGTIGGPNEGPLAVLKRCGGWSGSSELDESSLPVVISGDPAPNFVMAEAHPRVISYYASMLVNSSLRWIEKVDVFCGVGSSGRLIAFSLATLLPRRYVEVREDINVPGIFSLSHDIKNGENVVIVQGEISEPITQVIELVYSKGGNIGAVLSLYDPRTVRLNLDVVSIVRKDTSAQFSQNINRGIERLTEK